jgi:hypothetical protein
MAASNLRKLLKANQSLGIDSSNQREALLVSYTNLHNFYRLEKNMQPASEPTKLEHADEFVEYVGSGKLKDKNVLITGGELVQTQIFTSREPSSLRRELV